MQFSSGDSHPKISSDLHFHNIPPGPMGPGGPIGPSGPAIPGGPSAPAGPIKP